jgi:Undecaprenyl-phosphate galactose phosphotransferase WbaP
LDGQALEAAGVWTGSIAWLSIRLYMGLYPGYGVPQPEVLRRATLSCALAAVAHAASLFALAEASPVRLLALGIWLALIPSSALARVVVKRCLVLLHLFGRPVVIVGARELGAEVMQQLVANPGLGLVPVGCFDDDASRHGALVEGVPVLGPVSAAVAWRFPYPVRDVIFAAADVERARHDVVARELARRFPIMRVIPEFPSLRNLWVNVGALGTCLAFELRHDRFQRSKRTLKRAFDLAVGVPCFVASAPVIALAAVAVRLIDGGAPFYSQRREGLGGAPIRVWKIRTMVGNAESRLAAHLEESEDARREWGETMKLRRDPRVIPLVGALLRRTSVDELPQLWNVIRGDLSLVGPRPLPSYHLEQFSPEFRELRRQVPPGLTGLWQITHRSDGDLRAQEDQDSYYVHNWSLWLDLWILQKTARAVVAGRGAY